MLFAVFAAIAVFATVLTASRRRFFERDRLAARIKSVALEREKIRARERARLADRRRSARACATKPKPFMRQIVERFNLQKALADEKTVNKLRMAGYRGQAPLVVFLFARLVLPLVFFVRRAVLSLRGARAASSRPSLKILFAVVVAYVGFYRAQPLRLATSSRSGSPRSAGPGPMRSICS